MAFNLYAGNYKKLLVLPIVLTVILAYLAFVSPGLQQGLDIKGGTLIVVQTDSPANQAQVEDALQQNFDLVDLKVTATSFGVRIQFAESKSLGEAKQLLLSANQQLDSNPAQAKQLAIQAVSKLQKYNPDSQDLSGLDPKDAVNEAQNAVFKANENFSDQLQSVLYSTLNLNPDESRLQKKDVGAALGQIFWQNAITVTLIGMICITIVVFLFFREFIPTIAIVEAAIFDVLAALAFMAILNVPLSLATIPGLLMLIGYSIDTDILLTTRVLRKKEGTDRERAMDSLFTGMTMTITGLVGVTVMMLLSFTTGITLIYELGVVLVGGMLGDIIATWFTNGPILLWYAERKKKAKGVMN